MNLIIPMAGRGQRWIDAGYTFPKPLIEIKNKPMIELVLENININGNYIFICLKEHIEKFSLDTVLKNLKPDCKIISIDKVTEGAAATILESKSLINNDEPVIIANCDQWIDWSSSRFIDFINKKNPEGALVTYTSTHPRNSFVKINEVYDIFIPGSDFFQSKKSNICFSSFIHGAELKSYEFNLYKTKKKNKIINFNIRKIDIIKKKQKLDPILSGVNFTRDLVSEPGNILHPDEYAKRLLALKKLGI